MKRRENGHFMMTHQITALGSLRLRQFELRFARLLRMQERLYAQCICISTFTLVKRHG